MKTSIHTKLKSIVLLTIGIGLLFSCDYREYADADYPENMIYFATARGGIWNINQKTNEEPSMITPGYSGLYEIEGNTFSVVLGIVQSGIKKTGSFEIGLAYQADTIQSLIQEDVLPAGTVPIPESKLTFPAKVTFPANSQSVTFKASFPLDEITGANSGNQVVFALTITDSEIKPNPDLQTTVILIDSSFLE